MADARSRVLWHHTSSLMALIANVNRDRKQKPSPFRPSDFDPHSRPRGEAVSVAQLADEIMAITDAKQRQRERAANPKPKRMKAQNG